MKSLRDHKHELLLKHAQLDTERTDIVMAILRTANLIDRACAATLAEYDLTEGRLSALLATADGSTTPAAIAEQLGVTRAAVTGLLDGLDRQGLISRSSNPGDRRSITIGITGAGTAALAALRPVYSDWLQHIASGIPAGATTSTGAALAAIQAALVTAETADGARGPKPTEASESEHRNA